MDSPKMDPSFSKTISAGLQTFHLEIKKTKEGRSYLDFRKRRENEANGTKRRIVIRTNTSPKFPRPSRKLSFHWALNPNPPT